MTTRPVSPELARAVEVLTEEFAGIFGPETVRDCVVDSFEKLQPEATLTAYLPLFAHRFARERLRACGLAQGALPQDVPVVLFVCTHNAGRSQLAAALLSQAAAGRVTIALAGTAPTGAVDPVVLKALAERGIDASDAYPKPLTKRSSKRPTSSSRWAAATSARSFPAGATSTGSWPIRSGLISTPCGRSGTTSKPGCSCSLSSCSPRLRRHGPEHLS